jgi:hypothetical protein
MADKDLLPLYWAIARYFQVIESVGQIVRIPLQFTQLGAAAPYYSLVTVQ